MIIFSIQILITIALIQYLGSTLVFGKPRLAKKLSNGNEEGLRDYFLELSTPRQKRHVQRMSREGIKAVLGKAINYRHHQRIKRDLSSHPCYKLGSYKSISLSDGSRTFSVECLQSTTTGCFHNVQIYTTTLCADNRTYFPRTGQSVVQGCGCA